MPIPIMTFILEGMHSTAGVEVEAHHELVAIRATKPGSDGAALAQITYQQAADLGAYLIAIARAAGAEPDREC